jgi:hypothetical protein
VSTFLPASARHLIGTAIHSVIQSYYRSKVSSKVLAYSAQRAALKAYPPQFVDQYRLTRFIRERRPRVVWEYGSGWSTQFLAQALADNGTGMLYSMEADEFWAKNSQAMLPPWLQPHVELRFVSCEKTEVAGVCSWKYAWQPEAMPQLIYLDGPANVRDCPGNANLIEIEDKLERGCLIVVDGRQKSVSFLRNNFRRRWKYWHDPGPLGQFFGQFNQHYFELQD